MPSVAPGDVVADKYRVERMLGSGGMGYVVCARHLTLDQLVAIKFLSKGEIGDAEALARFRREGKAAVRLKNDHVAKVYDVGDHGDEPFIVMEYLDGADLSTVLKERGQVGIGEVCEYILQACEALAEAHAIGIVHRDVKPANLFLTRTASGAPLVKVLDFGVSKTLAAAEAQGDVTRTASMLGSPKYMSPEQMNDPRSVDARTDIWSLGVVLYRLVGGKAPFEGETIGRLCTMVLHEAPAALRTLRPDVPPTFEAVVAKCLAKDRARRFQNVAELAASLVPFCIDVERAREQARHVAQVVGVPPPPVGFLPVPPDLDPLRASAGSFAGPAAWSQTYAGPDRPAPKRRPELLLAAAMVGMIVVLGGIGVFVLRRTQPVAPAAAATTPPEPATQAATQTAMPSPPVVPSVIASAAIEPPPVTPAGPQASAAPGAPTTTATAKKPPGRPHGRGTGPARPPDDPLTILGDRK
jgi:hypothetical protein